MELAEASPSAPVVSNAAMRALSLIGDGAGALAFLRRLPDDAIDRGTYLLAMRAHKTDVDGCLALFRACEPATGEPVDEKLVARVNDLGEVEWVVEEYRPKDEAGKTRTGTTGGSSSSS